MFRCTGVWVQARVHVRCLNLHWDVLWIQVVSPTIKLSGLYNQTYSPCNRRPELCLDWTIEPRNRLFGSRGFITVSILYCSSSISVCAWVWACKHSSVPTIRIRAIVHRGIHSCRRRYVGCGQLVMMLSGYGAVRCMVAMEMVQQWIMCQSCWCTQRCTGEENVVCHRSRSRGVCRHQRRRRKLSSWTSMTTSQCSYRVGRAAMSWFKGRFIRWINHDML